MSEDDPIRQADNDHYEACKKAERAEETGDWELAVTWYQAALKETAKFPADYWWLSHRIRSARYPLANCLFRLRGDGKELEQQCRALITEFEAERIAKDALHLGEAGFLQWIEGMLCVSLIWQGKIGDAVPMFERRHASLSQTYSPDQRHKFNIYDQYAHLLPIPARISAVPALNRYAEDYFAIVCDGPNSVSIANVATGKNSQSNKRKPDDQILAVRLLEQAQELCFQATRFVQLNVYPDMDYTKPDAEIGRQITEEFEYSYKYPAASDRLTLAERKLDRAIVLLQQHVSQNDAQLHYAKLQLAEVRNRLAIKSADIGKQRVKPESTRQSEGKSKSKSSKLAGSPDNDKQLVFAAAREAVPEIGSGLIKIKCFARLPGVCTRIAVASTTPKQDAVACCQMRVPSVTKLLKEPVEFVAWSPDVMSFIMNALVGVKITNVHYSQAEYPDDVTVFVAANERVADGCDNHVLAEALTGKKISIVSGDEKYTGSNQRANAESLTAKAEAGKISWLNYLAKATEALSRREFAEAKEQCQQVLRTIDTLPSDEKEHVRRAIAGLLNVIQHSPEHGSGPASEKSSFVESSEAASWDERYDQGRKLLQERNYLAAAKVLEETLAQARKLFASPDNRLYENLFTLAHAQTKLELYRQAEANLEESVRLAEAAHGTKCTEVNTARLLLAMVLGYQEKYDAAVETWERARPYAENDPESGYLALRGPYEDMMKKGGSIYAAEAMVKHALDRQGAGHSDQAERVFMQAIEILTAAFGANHKRTSMTRQYLAKLYFECGQSEKASQFSEAGAARGQSQITQAITAETEAYKLKESGQDDDSLIKLMQARQLYIAGISALEVWLGEDDAQLGAPLCSYSSLLRELGYNEEADEHYARGQRLLRKR